MKKLIVIFVALALCFIASPANAAAKHKKTCANHTYAKNHPKKCKATKKVAAKPAPKKAAAPARVATKAEYAKLDRGMTFAQVSALFNAPYRTVSHTPIAEEVVCPQNGPYFCFNDDGTLMPGAIITIGPEDDLEWYTGVANQYDYSPGRACYGIATTFITNAATGVRTLARYENDSNVCPTNQDPG